MRNIAVSFFTGSVLAGIVFLLIFDVTPGSDATTEAQRFLGDNDPSRSDPLAVQAPSRSVPVAQPSERQQAEFSSVATGDPVANSDERLAELQAIIGAAERERNDILNARWHASLGPVISPVPLPPEFDWFGESVFYEHMQREPIDASSASKETQLMAYFVNSPQIIQKYGIPAIRCHTNRCLVTWLTSGSNETEELVQSDFRTLTDRAKDELAGPVDCSGIQGCFSGARIEDGFTTAVWGVKFEGAEVVPGLE